MNWKVGDIAICIKVGSLEGMTGNPPPLRLKGEYIVQNTYQCPKCRKVSLDVGLGSNGLLGTRCCSERIPIKEIHWCQSERFVKKDLRTKEEQIADAIAKEDYELAETIKKL